MIKDQLCTADSSESHINAFLGTMSDKLITLEGANLTVTKDCYVIVTMPSSEALPSSVDEQRPSESPCDDVAATNGVSVKVPIWTGKKDPKQRKVDNEGTLAFLGKCD